jgi:hypothetical protein
VTIVTRLLHVGRGAKGLENVMEILKGVRFVFHGVREPVQRQMDE